MYVSGLIRERRKERGWSQQDLAEHVSASRNPINRWERGWNGPTLPQRRKLAKALGGDPDEYMWTEEDHVHRDEQTRNQIEVRDLIRRLRGSDLSLQNGGRDAAPEPDPDRGERSSLSCSLPSGGTIATNVFALASCASAVRSRRACPLGSLPIE
jgi:putative transcriptional regulator